MDTGFLQEWRQAIEAAATSVTLDFVHKYGYPAGDNVVRVCGPQDQHALSRLAQLGVAQDLLDFYRVIAEVSLPDLGNGWFIHSLHWLASDLESPQIRAVSGNHEAGVIVFGSDGGGTLYALAIAGGAPVYRLPPDQVLDGIYHSQQATFEVAAADLRSFLIRLRDAVQHFAAEGTIDRL